MMMRGGTSMKMQLEKQEDFAALVEISTRDLSDTSRLMF